MLDGLRVDFAQGFAITGGGADQLELSPGQTHEVRLSGPDAGVFQSALLIFHVLGPNSVAERITLIPPH